MGGWVGGIVGWVNDVHPPFTLRPRSGMRAMAVIVGWVSVAHPPFRREVYGIAVRVPFTVARYLHGNAAARERVKGARRRPLHHPGSRPVKPALRAALASGVSLPVGRDAPSRGSRPLAVPDRQPGLNASARRFLCRTGPRFGLCVYGGCASLPTLRDGGAAVFMPDGATLRLVGLWWVRRLTHPTRWRRGGFDAGRGHPSGMGYIS